MELDFLLNIAIQVPIVVLFAWFVIKRDKDYDITRAARDKEWQKTFESAHDSGMADMKGVTEALNKLSEQLAKNTTTLILHDATARGENTETMGSTSEIFAQILDGKRKTDRFRAPSDSRQRRE